jgi:integrase
MNKGKAEDLIFKNRRGGQLLNWQKWQVRMMKRSGVIGWDRHSLRRTCATLAGELGAEPHVISALLGHRHIGSQLTSIYNKARYQTEHREALEAVGKEIDKICELKADQPVIIHSNSIELNNA